MNIEKLFCPFSACSASIPVRKAVDEMYPIETPGIADIALWVFFRFWFVPAYESDCPC